MDVYRNMDIIMVDMDDAVLPFPKENYEAEAKKILEFFGYEVLGFAYRLSNNKGIHIAVYIAPEAEWWQRPLFAYLLGSDPIRECLNYFRLSKGIDISVLFTAKKRIINKDINTVIIKGKENTENHWYKCLKNWNICKGLKRLIDLAKENGINRIEINNII